MLPSGLRGEKGSLKPIRSSEELPRGHEDTRVHEELLNIAFRSSLIIGNCLLFIGFRHLYPPQALPADYWNYSS